MTHAETFVDPAVARKARSFVGIVAAPRGWSLLVFVLALLLRGTYALIAPDHDPFLIRDPLLGDAASYDSIARTLLAGGAFGHSVGRPSTFWPPLYPYFQSGVYWLLGYDFAAARMVQAVLGAVLPVTIFGIGYQLGATTPARWASLGAVFYPHLVYFGAWLIAEPLFFALSGLALWTAAYMQRRPAVRKAAALGLLLGLAALAKPTMLMQLPFLGLWFLVSLSCVSLRRRFALGLVAALIMLGVIAPWTARNYRLTGETILISTNGGYTFYGANNADAFGGHFEHFPPRMPWLGEADEQAEYYRLGWQWIRSDPAQFTWLLGRKFSRLVSPLSIASSPSDMVIPGGWMIYTLYSGFLLIALYGLVLSLRQWRRWFLLYVPLLGVITSTFLFYGDVRYTLPAVASLLLFAAVGLEAVLSLFTARRHLRVEPR